MKKIAFISLAIILFCTACAPGAPKRYQVGVFDGFGGSQTCIWEYNNNILSAEFFFLCNFCCAPKSSTT